MGVLRDAVRCTVTEERNGAFELEMVYPITGQYYSTVTVAGVTADSRIAVSDRTRVTDAVRMVAALEPGAGVVKFYANSALTSAAVFVLEVSQ